MTVMTIYAGLVVAYLLGYITGALMSAAQEPAPSPPPERVDIERMWRVTP